LKIILFNM